MTSVLSWRSAFFLFALLFVFESPAAAQPAGEATGAGATPASERPAARSRFWPESLLLGLSIGRSLPLDGDATAGTDVSFVGGPPRRAGLSPSFSLGWFSTDVVGGGGTSNPAAQLRVRPVMGGLAWGQRVGTVLVEYSGVAGYAFNSAERPVEGRSPWHRSRLDAGAVGAVDDSLAWEVGVRVWRPLVSRLHGVVGASYLWTRPELTLDDGRRATWNADRLLIEAGVAWEVRLPGRRAATP